MYTSLEGSRTKLSTLAVAISLLGLSAQQAAVNTRRFGRALRQITRRRYTSRIKGLSGVLRSDYDRQLFARSLVKRSVKPSTGNPQS
jgi:hypothetical protein